MAPPRLAEEQINCGPFFIDRDLDGLWLSRATAYGEYDVARLARQIPNDQSPDVVVCHVDCGFGLKPRNLEVFRCPKILLAADSHWGERALSAMVSYAASEPFDRVMVLYDRHHIPFYRAAGLKNVHWFPGLTFAHSDERVDAAPASVRENALALVGKAGYHYRRQRIFAELIRANVPLAWRQVKQTEVLRQYGASLIGLNVSMNGDLNLRVFETIAGGAMLLTDRLSADSGLDLLLGEKTQKVSYSSAQELVELARYYLSHPAEATAIGAAGRRWFQERFSEQRRQLAFRELVFEGRERPEFSLEASRLYISFGAGGLELDPALKTYDVINELHRQQDRVVVESDDTVPAAMDALAATLPRVVVRRGTLGGDSDSVDLTVFSRDRLPPVSLLRNRRAWCWNIDDRTRSTITARMAQAGLQPLRAGGGLFAPTGAKSSLVVQVSEARRFLDAADLKAALASAQQAVARNPRDVDALLVVAELAWEAGNRELFRKFLEAARKAGPAHPGSTLLEWQTQDRPAPWQTARLQAMAWRALESLDFAAAEHYAQSALQSGIDQPEMHYALALAHARQKETQGGQHNAAVHAQAEIESLRKATQQDPSQVDYLLALALALRRENRLGEAAKAFEAYTSLDPKSAIGWLGLGESRLRAGLAEAAREALMEGLVHVPEHTWLKKYADLAVEQSGPPDASFTARLMSLEAADTTGPRPGNSLQWKQLVIARPNLGCIEALANDGSIPLPVALRLLHLAAEAGVGGASALRSHPVPQRTVLFAFQPWFGLNPRELVSRAYNEGVLLVLMDGEPPIAVEPNSAIQESDFHTVSHRGVNLWSLCQYRVSVQLRSLPKDIDIKIPAHHFAVAMAYRAAVMMIDRAHAYCEFFKPEAIVVAQGYDLVAAALRSVALQRGLRIVAIENTFHRERLLWEDISGIAVNINQAKNYYWRYRDAVSVVTAEAAASAFLDSIGQLKSVEHTSPAATPIPLGEGAGKTITYIGQVGVDSSVLFGLRGFASQVDLIAALAAYAVENDCRLLIKLHPKESPRYPDPVPYYRRLTAGWLEQHSWFQQSRVRLGANLVLDDENQFNTYEMIRHADVCVTITSQAGLEALLMGKEVVLCGDAFYGGLGFTHEATDAGDLRYSIDRVFKDGRRRNDGCACRKFFQIFTELYCIPKKESGLLRLITHGPEFPRVSQALASDISGGRSVGSVVATTTGLVRQQRSADAVLDDRSRPVTLAVASPMHELPTASSSEVAGEPATRTSS